MKKLVNKTLRCAEDQILADREAFILEGLAHKFNKLLGILGYENDADKIRLLGERLANIAGNPTPEAHIPQLVAELCQKSRP
jgi:hypothetical protein